MNNRCKPIDLSNLTCVFDLVEQGMAKFADKPAFTCFGQTLTFKEIEQKSRALACYLQQKTDLSPGDRIALQLPNIIQFPIAAYAAMRAGLVIVNTNPLYTTREMAHQFNDAQVKGIIILSDALPKLAEIIDDTVIKTVIVAKAGVLIDSQQGSSELNDDLEADVNNDFEAAAINQQIKQQFSPSIAKIGFAQAIAAAQGLSLERARVKGLNELALLQYTGGTTGLSKGAMLSHANLLSNVQQTGDRFSGVTRVGKDIYICPLPLYHIYAFLVNLLLAASQGAHNVLIPNPRDMDAFVKEIKPHAFTCFTGINTLFVALCHQTSFKTLDFSQLKMTISGGSALTSNVAHVWQQLTGCHISEGYGLSETSPVLCFNTPGHEKLGTVGWPLIETVIEIWDENNNSLKQGDAGEIVAKGPQVMSGYWQQVEASEQSLVNGYFKTGDIGFIHEDGRVQIVDRKKDMILVSGFNVYPNEVEEVLSLHPKVVESAVVGHPDEVSGEKVCAYIVAEKPNTSENKLTVEEIRSYCRTQLTGYKVPKDVHFIDELPKSTVGKVLRRELR